MWFRIIVATCLLTITGILVYESTPYQEWAAKYALARAAEDQMYLCGAIRSMTNPTAAFSVAEVTDCFTNPSRYHVSERIGMK